MYEQLDVEQFPYLTSSEEILRTNRPDFYLCPADVSPRGLRKAGTSYVNSFGTGYFGQPDSASLVSVVADNGPFSRTLGESFTTARIRDGLSHTAFFSEVAGYPPSQVGAVTRIPTRPATVQDWQQLVSDCLAESVAVVSNSGHADEWYTPGLGTSGYIHVAPPNGPSCNFDGAVQLSLYSASSVHGDGVNLLLGDGRVSFISNTVDLPLWRSLGTRDGRESVSWNP